MEQKRNASKVRDLAIGFFGWVIFHNLLWFITFLGDVLLDPNYKIIAAFEILMWLSAITTSFVLFAKKKKKKLDWRWSYCRFSNQHISVDSARCQWEFLRVTCPVRRTSQPNLIYSGFEFFSASKHCPRPPTRR